MDKFLIFILAFWCFGISNSLAVEANSKIQAIDFKEQCVKDLDFIRRQLADNSAPYKNNQDQKFLNWYEEGYKNVRKLIDDIGDVDDCNYLMKYYLYGFANSHIALRSYVKLPKEQYPGILSLKKGDDHIVFYKHSEVSYLKDISVGDKITHINNMPIAKYFEEYIKPFYAQDDSLITQRASSIYTLIVDGNRFVPVPKVITYEHDGKPMYLELKYTELAGEGFDKAQEMRHPNSLDKFKLEMVSSGVWIRIPSFFLTRSEEVYFSGMLANLRNFAKEDYILFDLRGNRGGAARFARPIIRNLWGDEFIKSLGDKNDYNKIWQRKERVSKENFAEFRKFASVSESTAYAKALKKGEDFYLKKWKIYDEDLNLYTNKDNSPVKAKIFVLTDYFCRSTCWNFVNELLQIPNVTHIGATTTIQGIYSYAKRVRAPSGNYDFFYPTTIRVQPTNKIGQKLVPSHIYDGDFRDEAGLTDWVLSIIEK